MNILYLIFSAVAGLIHIAIFFLESIYWGSASVNKIFRLDKELALANKEFAFNQGFYNIFLALQIFLGFYFWYLDKVQISTSLINYACLSMFGASLVLMYSNKKFIRAASIQGGPPALALIIYLFT